MGNVLTSGDLQVGFIDLGQSMLGDPTQVTTIHPKQIENLLVEDLCLNSNLPISDYKWLKVNLLIWYEVKFRITL